MRFNIGLIILLSVCRSAELRAQAPPRSRLDGYTGGPYKVVASDFTGDRQVDVVLGYRYLGVVAVYTGDGGGSFSATTLNAFTDAGRRVYPNDESWSAPHVHNMAYGDLDRDGLPDLVLAVGGLSVKKPGRVILARNAGHGQLRHMREYSLPSQAKGVCLADMDNDGRLDLLYTARGSGYTDDLKRGRLSIRQGLGDWKFGRVIESDAGRSAYYVETADLNNDGYLDVMIPNEHDTCVTFFLNPGRTLFSAADHPLTGRILRATPIPNQRSHAVNDVRAADLDGDGNQDLLTANLGTSTVSVFPGNGDGTFQKDILLEAGKNGAFLETGDFDTDGDIDFVITHWTEDFASVFLNAGDGTFADRVDYRTGSGNYGVAVADLDQDGDLDIITANYREKSMSLLSGVGDGTFSAAGTRQAGLRSYQGRWIPHHPD